MKRILSIVAVAVACAAFSLDPGNVQAQDLDGLKFGYGFGVGRDFARDGQFRGGHFRFRGRGFHGVSGIHQRIEQPPYFALFPPVYYSSEIVRRPMGVSPFAAPPGIVPVEMTAPQSVTIINPYVPRNTNPASEATENESSTDVKNIDDANKIKT